MAHLRPKTLWKEKNEKPTTKQPKPATEKKPSKSKTMSCSITHKKEQEPKKTQKQTHKQSSVVAPIPLRSKKQIDDFIKSFLR